MTPSGESDSYDTELELLVDLSARGVDVSSLADMCACGRGEKMRGTGECFACYVEREDDDDAR